MEHNRHYMNIAKRLIRTKEKFEDIAASDVKIAYLSSQMERKKDKGLVYGECTKVDKRYKWCCHYDFFITIYEPNIAGFTEKQLEILIEHELEHVGIDWSGNEVKYYIVPHTVQDFRDIIDEYGIDWSDKDA